ncbi:MAG TPA: type II secretion system protein [Candidatus Sumerlaeota bacterium]|nr:type II secretion system protein [Candidatus Sumerlaeota bacterium]
MRKSKAFTLLELLVVATITSILAYIAVLSASEVMATVRRMLGQE